MLPISVVIIASNEAHNIERCVHAVTPYFDEVLVAVNNSIDDTYGLAESAGAKVIEVLWSGYSNTKNEVHKKAQHDWILSLDADEVVDNELVMSIVHEFSNEQPLHKVFSIKRRLIYNGQALKYGSVSNELRPRLFHRDFAKWNSNLVHEELMYKGTPEMKVLEGLALHYSYLNEEDHKKRLEKYARLFAEHMYANGKKAPWFKTMFSPYFGFIKNVVFRLGILDGNNGIKFAWNEMQYTKKKYQYLKELNTEG